MKKALLLLVPLLIVTLAVGACATGDTITKTVTSPPEAAQPPAGVIDDIPPGDFSVDGYLASVCAQCHGEGLGGDVGPTLQGLGTRMTAAEAAAIIADGRHGTSMPTWDGLLTNEQIDRLPPSFANQADSSSSMNR